MYVPDGEEINPEGLTSCMGIATQKNIQSFFKPNVATSEPSQKEKSASNMRWFAARDIEQLVDTILKHFGNVIPRALPDVKNLGELMPGASNGMVWNLSKLCKRAINIKKDGRDELSLY